MIYLEKEDLITDSFERFIDESSLDENFVLNNIELKVIGKVKSYLGTRYDVESIFDEDEPIRNQVIIDILVKLFLKKLFKRNAARKLPSDISDDHKEALEELEKIATGRIPISDLPQAVDEDGNLITSNSVWGNNKNEDFYI